MSTIKAVYVMAFTPQQMESQALMQMCRLAASMLEKKDPAFAQLMAVVNSTKITLHFSNQVFVPIMHTPQVMQKTMGGWLKDKLTYHPVYGQNFFANGLNDPQGRAHFVLFYFDLE